jgi:hypothetical protein
VSSLEQKPFFLMSNMNEMKLITIINRLILK